MSLKQEHQQADQLLQQQHDQHWIEREHDDHTRRTNCPTHALLHDGVHNLPRLVLGGSDGLTK